MAFFADGPIYYHHQNWLGTERMRTTYNGTVEESYPSLPFGDGLSATGGDDDAHHFAGLDHDASSDTEYAPYRQYGSSQGRWMTPDPYIGSYDLSNPQSMNRYAYARNNPLTYVDPLGLDPLDLGLSEFAWAFGNVYWGSDFGDGTGGGGSAYEQIGDGAPGGGGGGGSASYGPPTLAPNNNPCANATLSAAGVTAQQQINTAQGFIAGVQAAANATPYANPVLGFLGGMFGYFEAVHTGGPNDIKNQPGPGYHNQIGVDAGNISYGITCPYGAGFCQFAAGLAQTLSGDPNPNGTFITGYDTPSDNVAIRVGQAMRAAGCHE